MSILSIQSLAPIARSVVPKARQTLSIAIAAAVAVGVLLGMASCETVPSDVRFANADGHRTAYRVVGTGQPVIVMISGLGDGMATFQDVATELASNSTVILYDRAGYGSSASAVGRRDAVAFERELSALLRQSGASGPYVLVGHSLGGLYAEYFAALHPDLVSGVILEESRPAGFTRLCKQAGVSGCAPPTWMAWLPGVLSSGGRAELASAQLTSDEVERSHPAQGIPVLVISRQAPENPSAFDLLWSDAQNALVSRYAGARHRIAVGSGHYVHLDQRQWFVETVQSFISQDLLHR